MNNISVIGFGKIGQAIAANILKYDLAVTAIDTDVNLQHAFSSGKYSTKEPGLTGILKSAYQDKKLTITTDYAAIKGTDAVIVAIPLLIDAQKAVLDVPFLEAFRELAPHLENKIPIVIETSMPVGFARRQVVPAIEETGKRHGTHFLLSHSPERIKSGTMLKQLLEIPKVMGGIDAEALKASLALYRCFFPDHLLRPVDSIEAAEMMKLAGMIYRDVNIALSNQLARYADTIGVSFADLIPLINTDKEADLLYPGIGVGGHCTPVYPWFMIHNFQKEGLQFTLASESRLINDRMAEYALSLVVDKVQDKTALILGLSFRPNVKEDALSVAYRLQEVLRRAGFGILLHDTEYSAKEIRAKGFEPLNDIYQATAEVVFVVTMHKEYYDLDFGQLYKNGVRFLVDGRNNIDRGKVQQAGISYHGIGRQ